MSSLLLVEDNEELGPALEKRLANAGYRVTRAGSVAAATLLLGGAPFDIAIVDLGLPDGSGLDFARALKERANTPIVFLTASSSPSDRLEGFELGAADYIPKPFHMRELLLRIERVLSQRRPGKIVRCGAVRIDLDSMSVTDEEGRTEFLARRDFELLKLLMESSPRVLSRGEIIAALWGEDSAANQRSIDNAVVRLRQALGDRGAAVIRSVRGVGYQWASREE